MVPNHRQQLDERKGTKKARWPRYVAIAAILALALVVGLKAVLPTVEKELARFDAARAVPDADNAALIYAELLRGEQMPPVVTKLSTALARIQEATLDPVSLCEFGMSGRELVALELPEGLLDPNDEDFTLREPWTSATYPELRQWLDTQQDRIDRLLEAAQKPVCYFPLRPGPNQTGLFDVPLGALRQNVFLLRRAANNDMAEGRTAMGLEKYQTLISIGRHLQAQPAQFVLSTGIGCEAMGLHHVIDFIVTGPATDRDLDTLAASCRDLEDNWRSLSQSIVQVRHLYSQTLEDRRPFKLRLYWWYRSVLRRGDTWSLKDRTSELYHRVLSERRALGILIGLRRFKNRTGHWPDRLDEVASSVTALALVDSQNGGSYVYQNTGDGFRLYSTGPNGRDEGGQYAWKGPDDWPIWPPRGSAAQRKPADPNGV